jgi:hypothetical protein
LLLKLTFISYGQEQQPQQPGDTILLKKGQTLVTPDRSVTAGIDTLIIIPAHTQFEIAPSKSEAFFKRLAENADKRLWTREIHNIIISNHRKSNPDTLKTSSSVTPFIFYTGKHIRKIYIKRLEVFGPTINDTTGMPNSWIERTGNKLHHLSREYLIRNSLMFHEKDSIDPTEIADNERVLRSLPYIEDAKIMLRPVSNLSDSTDVIVLVKDVWSTAFNIRVDNIYSGRFELWDRNILGFGHEFQNTLLWNNHEIPTVGYQGAYVVNNISNSFISGKINYYNSFHTKSFGMDFERSFFTPNIKYAGGVSFLKTQTRTLFEKDTTKFTPINFNNYDLWTGRSFLLRRNGFSKLRQNITLSTRLMRDYYFDRPKISKSSYYNYQDKLLLLSSASYSRHSYFKSNYIYNFGRTEDIPIGGELEFTFGAEFNEFFTRKYAGAKLSKGVFLGYLGYIYSSVQTGSFFTESGKAEQAVINAKMNYFSPLFLLSHFHFRQFVTVDYTVGFNRFSNEYLTFNKSYASTSFVNDSTKGDKRFIVHWETDCFTPWEFYDFHFVLFAFADHSWLATSGNLLRKYPYTDLGLGIRIRNEHLVFNTIQFKFSFYPRIPSGSKTSAFELSGESLLNPPNFLPQAPHLIPYQ